MNEDLTLELDGEPKPEDVAALGRGLHEHALPLTGTRGFNPLAVFARDPSGEIVGGVYAHVNWTWLSVNLLWVAAGRRGTGLGSHLLASIEEAGRERGCLSAHLDTFSYQARPFYERQGYTVFASLPDYPPGHTRWFLRKRL